MSGTIPRVPSPSAKDSTRLLRVLLSGHRLGFDLSRTLGGFGNKSTSSATLDAKCCYHATHNYSGKPSPSRRSCKTSNVQYVAFSREGRIEAP
jgi:hypothetical protein